MGGEHMCLQTISQKAGSVPHLFPLSLCLKPLPMGSMIQVPKIGALQFVIIKPALAAVSILVYALGLQDKPAYTWGLVIIYNLSYSVALYAFYLIYWASHNHQSLKSKSPLLKFLTVKAIVFL